MRININNQVFEKGKLADVLTTDSDVNLLIENNWFYKNNHTSGFVKDIRSEGVCFLSYKLDIYKNNEILISSKAPLFKLHFEFNGEVKYKSSKSENKHVTLNKDTFEFFYIIQGLKKTKSNIDTKNSVEVFFDEAYLRKISGKSFLQLLKILKEDFNANTLNQNGIFIIDEILKIINDIKNCEYTGCKRQVYLELKIKELIIVAITHYENNYKFDETLHGDKIILLNIEKHIKENLNKDLTIADLSILSGMNTSKFKKCFKQLYGITVFKYITALRIEKAKKLIQENSYTISQASYEVGYKNAQHFTVAFKKNIGYLPSKLKNK